VPWRWPFVPVEVVYRVRFRIPVSENGAYLMVMVHHHLAELSPG
jgi:hypothetical protein